MRELAREVSDLLRATIRLNVKMNNISAAEDQLEPEELADLSPRDVSFYVASFFSDIKLLQQNVRAWRFWVLPSFSAHVLLSVRLLALCAQLLEEESTLKRLEREKEILSETVRYYSAASALKGAFSSGGGSAGGSGGSSESSSGDKPMPPVSGGGGDESPSSPGGGAPSA